MNHNGKKNVYPKNNMPKILEKNIKRRRDLEASNEVLLSRIDSSVKNKLRSAVFLPLSLGLYSPNKKYELILEESIQASGIKKETTVGLFKKRFSKKAPLRVGVEEYKSKNNRTNHTRSKHASDDDDDDTCGYSENLPF